MKVDQLQQIEFIKDYLRKGIERKAILQEFTKAYKGNSIKTFDNRLKVAREQIRSEYKTIEKRTENIITKEVRKRKAKILTALERQQILSQIARGEIPLNKPMVVDGKIELVQVVPNWMDRKAAITELNRMTGDIAPTKTELNVMETPSVIIPGKKKTD